MTHKPREGHGYYPKDSYWHDVEKVQATQIIGGLGEKSDLIVSKSVFPGFQKGQEVKFRVQLALLMSRIKARKTLLDAINTGITIKGIGNIDSLPETREASLLAQGGDFLAGQVGAGGIVGVGQSLWKKYTGITDQETKVFKLRSKDRSHRGRISISNRLFANSSGLRKTALGRDKRFDFDDSFSGVVFSEILVHLTSDEVNRILEESSFIDLSYDETPRLVVRLNYPIDQLDSIGNRPEAFMASYFVDKNSEDERPEIFYAPIDIPSVRYDKTTSAKTTFEQIAAELLGISQKKIISFWPLLKGIDPPKIENEDFSYKEVEIDGKKFLVLIAN